MFILTSDFNCLLYKHSVEEGTYQLQSSGNISENIGQKREPHYSIFVGSKYIALMLYENTVKIVPLKKEEGNIVLKNPFNIRIRHPEAQLLIPLHLDDKVSDGTIAVFYQ